MVNLEHRSPPIEGLPTENATERAVVLFSDLSDDGVHGPAVKLVVRQDFERHIILLLVTLHGLPYV